MTAAPSPNIDMREAATLAGVHYDTLRKRWTRMVRADGFPAPFKVGGRGASFMWDRDEVLAWRKARGAAARLRCFDTTPPANDSHPAPRPASPPPGGLTPAQLVLIARQRAKMTQSMRR